MCTFMTSHSIKMFCIISLVLFCSNVISLELVVQTRLGEVRGIPSAGEEYAMFLGVPYAVVNEERPFEEASPHPGYTEPILAYDDDIICPQIAGASATGTLQCLVTHIYVPAHPPEDGSFPVMVYVHGGAWIEGSGDRRISNPHFLVQKGVIVINIQYRVGMYGFLCTDSPKAPGNMGLRDQYLALTWIKENIDSFGGDPERITLFGQSAGAMSVHLQLLSHHEPSFQRVIIQSGSSSSPWTLVEQSNHVPIEIAKELGFDTEYLNNAIDFLSSANVDDVVRIGAELGFSTAANNNQPLTKACVERAFEEIESFVPVHSNVAHSVHSKDIDVMIGFNSEEMIWQYGNRDTEFFNTYSFIELLDFGFDTTDMNDMSTLLRHFYIGDEATSPDLEHEITQYASDLVWNHPTQRAIKLLLEDEVKSLYQYVFSYEGDRNVVGNRINTTVPGATHADELGYIFDAGRLQDQEDTPADLRMVEQMTTMWTNFAKYGDPTPVVSDLLPIKWEALKNPERPATTHFYLNIDNPISIGNRPYHDRTAFWDLFYEANKHYAAGFNNNI